MSFNFSFHYEKVLSLSQDASEIFRFLKNYPEALPNFFPGLHRFEEQSPQIYFWEFEPLNYAGKQLTISFSTLFEEVEPRIRMFPQSSDSETTLRGEWNVVSNPNGCDLKMHFDLEFSVPLPKLMKAVVAPMASAELSKLFERYAKNLEKHFS